MKIYHLYSQLMNLYGEYANLLAINRMVQNAAQPCEIACVQSAADIDYTDCSLVYIGAGTEKSIAAAAADICANGTPIVQYLDNGGFLLATGGAGALFARQAQFSAGTATPTLGYTDASYSFGKRVYGDVLCTALDGQTAVASYNTPFTVQTALPPLFSVFYDSENKLPVHEGLRKNNLFSTLLIGPLFQRNPQLCKSFVSLLLPDTELSLTGFEHALLAHNDIVAELRRHCK